MKDKLIYLGRSAAGCYGNYKSIARANSLEKRSVSGLYESLDKYYHLLAEGGWVCDKSVVFRSNYSLASSVVVSGPMLDIDLDVNMVRPLLSGPQRYTGEDLGGGHFVSLDIYLNIWEKLGARVGRRAGRYIVWKDGTKELIYG